MDRQKLFRKLSTLVILIFLVNFVANKLYWYSSVWYFDIIMHFSGGFWLALTFLWFFAEANSNILPISGKLIFKIMLGVLSVGVLWEVFEVSVDKIIVQNTFNTLDTFSDLFFDLSGGLSALFYFSKSVIFQKENTV